MTDQPKEAAPKTCCFDYSHSNVLTIEAPSYSDFTQFLFGSSIRIGKIEAGFSSLDKLQKYQMIVIGGPRESTFEIEEINVLEEYVKKGGNLLVISDEGGDFSTSTNLSDLTTKFGFMYNPDVISDSMNYSGNQNRIVVSQIEPHSTTRGVDQLLISSTCSIHVDELIEADENIHITQLAKTGLNSFRKRWNGEEWIEEEDAPRSVLAVAVNYYLGRVVGLTTVSTFSSLSSAYGFMAMDNQKFITNTFNWLLEPVMSEKGKNREDRLISVSLNQNISSWMEKLVNKKDWANTGDIINFALKYMKDNYDQVRNSVKERLQKLKRDRQKELDELKKIQDTKERQRQAILLDAEENILKLVDPNRSHDSSELQDIMKSLQNVSGGTAGVELDPRLKQNEEAESLESPSLSEESSNIENESEESKNNENEEPSEQPPMEENVGESALPSEDHEESSEKPPTEESASEPTPDFSELVEGTSEAIKQDMEEKFTNAVQSKRSQSNEETQGQRILKNLKHGPSEVDKELDDALKTMGSFDDFTKQIDEFTAQATEEPNDETETSLPAKKKKLDDEDVFQ